MIKLDKSYFFEFAGLPKSGKTTIIECVRHFFRRNGFIVKNFNGHDRNVPIDKSDAFELNMTLASHAVEYINTSYVADSKFTIHFLDRGIFDRSVFTEKLRRERKISNNEAEIITQFLLMERNCKIIDGLFVFVVDPETSLIREYSKTLIPAPGRVMNINYLNELKLTLLDCYDINKSKFKKHELILTDNNTFQQTGLYIAKQIWQIIGGDINEFPIL